MGALLVFGVVTRPFRRPGVGRAEGPATMPGDWRLKLMLFGVIVLLFARVLATNGGLLRIAGDLVGVIGLGLGIAGLRR